MKIGKRTQAYAFGFILGIVLVSILIDFRRNRFEEQQLPEVEWKRAENIRAASDVGSVSIILEEIVQGEATGRIGQYALNEQGHTTWTIIEADSAQTTYWGNRFQILSQPMIESKLMQDGFTHLGYTVIEADQDSFTYVIEKSSLANPSDFLAAQAELLEKDNFIAEANWVLY